MRIGNINLPAGAGLAPMAGVTDAAMRLLCHESGAACVGQANEGNTRVGLARKPRDEMRPLHSLDCGADRRGRYADSICDFALRENLAIV